VERMMMWLLPCLLADIRSLIRFAGLKSRVWTYIGTILTVIINKHTYLVVPRDVSFSHVFVKNVDLLQNVGEIKTLDTVLFAFVSKQNGVQPFHRSIATYPPTAITIEGWLEEQQVTVCCLVLVAIITRKEQEVDLSALW
jgi:hypothetical protein